MKILHRLEDFTFDGPVVLTQGTFDGIHLGHQKILKRIVNEAKKSHAKSVLLTFYPHPRLVLYPDDNELKLLTTLHEKSDWLREFGLDYLIVLPFTKELSRLEPYEFVKMLNSHLNITKFIIGYDHRFGKNREGDIDDLMEYAKIFEFEVEEISRHDIDDCKVSSSTIRTSILEGNIVLAGKLLGRRFALTGQVIHGEKRGTKLGYPTANIRQTDSYKISPATGVYAVCVKLYSTDQVLGGMMNIGTKPTFGNGEVNMEVNIFDFTADLYGQEITIEFVDRLRDEIKFANVDGLIHQLKIDEANARNLLKNVCA